MEIYGNWYEMLVFVYDIQAHILYVIIPNYTISLCDNNELHICKALCHIYIHSIYRVAKYGIIMLSYKMYAYCRFF